MVLEATVTVVLKDKIVLAWIDPESKQIESGLADKTSSVKEGDMVTISLTKPLDKAYYIIAKYWKEQYQK